MGAGTSGTLIAISIGAGVAGLLLMRFEFDWRMIPTLAMYALMAAAAIRLASR